MRKSSDNVRGGEGVPEAWKIDPKIIWEFGYVVGEEGKEGAAAAGEDL